MTMMIDKISLYLIILNCVNYSEL